MSQEPRFRKGDPVFVRVEKGGRVNWRRGVVIGFDRWDERGVPVYGVYFGGLSGAFSVVQDTMSSADLEALTAV